MVIQLIACFGILHSSSFDLAGLIQPILSMFYFEKDQNAQKLTQIKVLQVQIFLQGKDTQEMFWKVSMF